MNDIFKIILFNINKCLVSLEFSIWFIDCSKTRYINCTYEKILAACI